MKHTYKFELAGHVRSMMQGRAFIISLYALVLLLAASLRVYELGDPPKPVFDEVYFPKFAYEYAVGDRFYHTHPPLGRYAFYLGMKAYYALPWNDASQFGKLEFEEVPTVAYRWVNACIGVVLCMVVLLLARSLSGSHVFALLAGLFVAIDGAIVVSARFGLSNAHITFWGFLGLALFVRALQRHFNKKYLLAAAICFGCVISVKWNGLSYWLVAVGFLWGAYLIVPFKAKIKRADGPDAQLNANLSAVNLKTMIGVFALFIVVPLAVYRVVWIPDRLHNDNTSFAGIHKQNWGYHSSEKKVGDHPYCSAWYSWPVMQRPIGYYFEKIPYTNARGETQNKFKDIHSFGNPILYWFASVAMLVVLVTCLKDAYGLFAGLALMDGFYLRVLICAGYFASWLPWAFVSRCTFLYHYQSASIFSFFALAWCLNALYKQPKWRAAAVSFATVVVLLIVASFIYFLPISLGIELERDHFYDRMWFRSWI